MDKLEDGRVFYARDKREWIKGIVTELGNEERSVAPNWLCADYRATAEQVNMLELEEGIHVMKHKSIDQEKE